MARRDGPGDLGRRDGHHRRGLFLCRVDDDAGNLAPPEIVAAGPVAALAGDDLVEVFDIDLIFLSVFQYTRIPSCHAF